VATNPSLSKLGWIEALSLWQNSHMNKIGRSFFVNILKTNEHSVQTLSKEQQHVLLNLLILTFRLLRNV